MRAVSKWSVVVVTTLIWVARCHDFSLSEVINRFKEVEAWAEAHPDSMTIKGSIDFRVPSYPQSFPVKIQADKLAWLEGGINMKEIEFAKIVRQYLETIDPKEVGVSRTCTAKETSVLKEKSQNIMDSDICSELLYYKILQVVWPVATNFIDIGCNRGFLASSFLSLWGGNNLHISPLDLNRAIQKANAFPTNPHPHGVCKTGLNRGYPLYCPGGNREETGHCDHLNKDIRVVGIDGSTNTVAKVSKIIETDFGAAAGLRDVAISELFQYKHKAMSNTSGTAVFTIKDQGDEGSRIIKIGVPKKGRIPKYEVVPKVTVDDFLLNEESFFRGQTVDVLKIDAEDSDLEVCVCCELLLYPVVEWSVVCPFL